MRIELPIEKVKRWSKVKAASRDSTCGSPLAGLWLWLCSLSLLALYIHHCCPQRCDLCFTHNAAAMTLVSRCSWRCGLCACRTLPLRMVLQVPIQYTPGVFLFFCLLIPLPSPPNIIFSNSITDFVTKPLFYLHSVVLNTRLSLQPSITPHQQGKRHLYASVYFPTSCLFFSLRV